MPHDRIEHDRRIAYLSAQAVVEGQDSWAAVTEVVRAIESQGWRVDLYRPEYAVPVPGVLTRVARILGAQWKLVRGLRRYRAVYARAHPLAWPAVRLAHALGVPVVQESNGSWEDAFAAWPATRRFARLVIALQRDQYRRADGIIAVSAGLAEWLRAEVGRGDAVVSPNGANTDVFRPGLPRRAGLPDRYVVFFGQFAPWQRLEVLLAAYERPEWPAGVGLVIVGDGQLRPLVEDAAERHGGVRHLGPLPYEEVPPVVAGALASAVLTFAPERAGYSPLKLYESMACGVPIICSDTPGQAEFVREAGSGIVVPPEDPAAVARAAAAIAGDPAAAASMGARGRAAVEERYSWEAVGRARLAVVERAVARRAGYYAAR